jgi:putative transcriptional regulator
MIYLCMFASIMNKIKEVLSSQGRSQKWLADQLGKSYIVVTNYCNNKNQPSLTTLYDISEILNVDVRELLTPTGELS